MRYVGEASSPVDQNDRPLDGPTFVYRDPLSERLLFARAAWELTAKPELPATFPKVEIVGLRTSDAERVQLTAVWLSAWNNLWAVYDSANSAATDELVISGSARPELLEWRSTVEASRLLDRQFAEWSGAMPPAETLGPRYLDISIVAHDAFQRGLASVYVLPVAMEWWTAPGDHILLISRAVHDSTDLLIQALESF